MPVKTCEENKKPGYKWGNQGKCYTYTPDNEGERRNAKKSAIIQGIAVGDYDLLPKEHPKNKEK